jgi:hypothetical protein
MTMGPAPMIRIDLMSVRLGMGACSAFLGLARKTGGVAPAGSSQQILLTG